jgi:putative transposase
LICHDDQWILPIMQRRKVTYKLYQTVAQATKLADLLRHHKDLYNAALQHRISAWRLAGIAISYERQCAELAELRRDPERRIANCSSEQVTLRRVKKAFDGFFRRCKAGQKPGFPRYKSLHGDGWRFTPGVNWRHDTLRLQGALQW